MDITYSSLLVITNPENCEYLVKLQYKTQCPMNFVGVCCILCSTHMVLPQGSIYVGGNFLYKCFSDSLTKVAGSGVVVMTCKLTVPFSFRNIGPMRCPLTWGVPQSLLVPFSFWGLALSDVNSMLMQCLPWNLCIAT